MFLGICVIVIIAIAYVVLVVIHRLTHVYTPFKKAAAAMQRPENYVPAELYLARLWQSDSSLMHSDSEGTPPDWISPELGRLQPHYVLVTAQGMTIGGGGGFIDFFGYDFAPDPGNNGESFNAYTLTYRDDHSERVLDRFTIPASERLTENEFVRLGLAELSGREAALESGRPNVYVDDPVADRRRLLRQHPKVAAELGLQVLTTTESRLLN